MAEHFTCLTRLTRLRRQLDGRHLLLRVYLQTGTALYLLNFPIKMHYRYEEKHALARMTNKAIIEFGFRKNRYEELCRAWRVLSTSICIILHILLSLVQ